MRRVVACVSVLVLAAVLIASMGSVAAQEASPAASPVALPAPLAEWAAAYSSGDADRLLALYTDDALWEEVAIGLAATARTRSGPTSTGSTPPCPTSRSTSPTALSRAIRRWWSGRSPAPTAAISPDCHPPPASTSRFGGLQSSSWRTGRSAATPSIGTPTSSWCSSGRCRRPAQRHRARRCRRAGRDRQRRESRSSGVG